MVVREKIEPIVSDNAMVALKARYLIGDETPKDLFIRVSKHVASAEPRDVEEWEDKFYDLMASFKFLPNSPTLFNAGVKDSQGRYGTLSACYVLDIEDTMEGINHSHNVSALIQKWGGGIGYNFSKLRPKGAKISSTHGRACGPVKVIKHYSSLSDMITQGGKRHGANMAILRIDHPDILEFIHMKDDDKTAQNFNISVAVTDEFMDDLENRPDTLWPKKDERFVSYDSWDSKKEFGGRKTVSEIWEEIAQSAWKTGDPGLWFVDRANAARQKNMPELVATNPCGEQALGSYESCNLGSMNIGKYVDPEHKNFNWPEYKADVRLAIRFLDDVVTVNKHPTKELQDASDNGRRIGLGIMGFADALFLMGIRYDSNLSVKFAQKICSVMKEESENESFELALSKGSYPWISDKSLSRRNSCLTTIAPTGTIARIADCSSGIEPYFSLAWKSNILDGKQLVDCPYPIRDTLKDRVRDLDKVILDLANDPSLQTILFNSEEQDLLGTANNIDWTWHVDVQAACQESIENSISKTINMPNSATVEDIKGSYRRAWNKGCRGITIYRDGSKSVQVLETGNTKKSKESVIISNPIPKEEFIGNGNVSKSPLIDRSLSGKRYKIETGSGRMYVMVFRDPPGLVKEIFTVIGHSGGVTHSHLEAIGRLMSWGLKRGGTVEEIIEHLEGIQGGNVQFDQGVKVESLPDAIATVLKWDKDIYEGNSIQNVNDVISKSPSDLSKISVSENPCPHCSGEMQTISGCDKCFKCGYSSC